MAFRMTDFGMPNFWLLGANACVLDIPGRRSLSNQERIWRLHARARDWDGVIERVPGMNNLTLFFDPEVVSASVLQTRLLELWSAPDEAASERVNVHTIPVRYGGEYGPDLQLVCEASGLGEREVISRHLSREYRVYFVGFQPGFAYLGDLDEALYVPRRATPRARVPAGSVAIGGTQTGIYPFEGPGGWNIIGATSVTLFDPSRKPAALFAPGDIVRFTEL
jgi:5-oxoprolinase (ATP-hydrolysing) subunit B